MYSKSIQCSKRSCNHYAYLQRFWKKKSWDCMKLCYFSIEALQPTTTAHCHGAWYIASTSKEFLPETAPVMMAETLAQATSSTGNCVSIVSTVKIESCMATLCQNCYCKHTSLYYAQFCCYSWYVLPSYYQPILKLPALPQKFQSSSGLRILNLAL